MLYPAHIKIVNCSYPLSHTKQTIEEVGIKDFGVSYYEKNNTIFVKEIKPLSKEQLRYHLNHSFNHLEYLNGCIERCEERINILNKSSMSLESSLIMNQKELVNLQTQKSDTKKVIAICNKHLLKD